LLSRFDAADDNKVLLAPLPSDLDELAVQPFVASPFASSPSTVD